MSWNESDKMRTPRQPFGEDDEKEITRHLAVLPNDHWAHRLYQEMLRLRDKRKTDGLIVGRISVDEKGGSIDFLFEERT